MLAVLRSIRKYGTLDCTIFSFIFSNLEVWVRQRLPLAGSPAVLQHVGAARAKCAVITLDTPGANYRSVWAMNKNFPGAKIFVRAHDVEHGLNLEQAGATAGQHLL